MHIGKHAYIAACLTVFSAYPAVVAADELPRAFRGGWGATKKECNPKSVESNNQVTVSANHLAGYEWSCNLKKLKSSSASNIEGIFVCSEAGEDPSDPETIKMALLNDGNILLLRHNKLMRCK